MYIIASDCAGAKDYCGVPCCDVCPVNAVHLPDKDRQYRIDPAQCIDCGACVDVCAVHAITPETEGSGG